MLDTFPGSASTREGPWRVFDSLHSILGLDAQGHLFLPSIPHGSKGHLRQLASPLEDNQTSSFDLFAIALP